MAMDTGNQAKDSRAAKRIVGTVTELRNLFNPKTRAGFNDKIAIDYPVMGERLDSGHYAVRISASGGDQVQISVDRGEWMWCRSAGGYYWFDWHSIPSGRHEIVARMKLASGKFEESSVIGVSVN